MLRPTLLAAFTLLIPAIALAQTVESVAGIYTAVTAPAFGDKPRGMLILSSDGRYTAIITRAMLPKIAAGLRSRGTADEYKAIVDGSVAHYGRYSIDDSGKTISLHIEVSTFANWEGATQKRQLKISGDLLSYTVTQRSNDGPANEVVWRRAK